MTNNEAVQQLTSQIARLTAERDEARDNRRKLEVEWREAHAESARLRALADRLAGLLYPVTLDEMGGTPDLFAPHDGWEVWDELARAALREYKGARRG